MQRVVCFLWVVFDVSQDAVRACRRVPSCYSNPQSIESLTETCPEKGPFQGRCLITLNTDTLLCAHMHEFVGFCCGSDLRLHQLGSVSGRGELCVLHVEERIRSDEFIRPRATYKHAPYIHVLELDLASLMAASACRSNLPPA